VLHRLFVAWPKISVLNKHTSRKGHPFAQPADPGYREGMAKTKNIDPFVCDEPAVEISPATSRILKQRMKTADEGRLVSVEKARQRMQQWLSKSSTTKTR
jgi:hypothetical protein